MMVTWEHKDMVLATVPASRSPALNGFSHAMPHDPLILEGWGGPCQLQTLKYRDVGIVWGRWKLLFRV